VPCSTASPESPDHGTGAGHWRDGGVVAIYWVRGVGRSGREKSPRRPDDALDSAPADIPFGSEPCRRGLGSGAGRWQHRNRARGRLNMLPACVEASSSRKFS